MRGQTGKAGGRWLDHGELGHPDVESRYCPPSKVKLKCTVGQGRDVISNGFVRMTDFTSAWRMG